MSVPGLTIENDGSFTCMDYKVGKIGRVEFVNTKNFVGLQTNFAINNDFLPLNDPPYPQLNTDSAFDMLDCFLNDDERGFSDSMGKLLEQTVSFKRKGFEDQSPVTRCQTSCEKSLFELIDLKQIASDMDRELAFLNPNIGTLKRFYESECSLRTCFDNIDIIITDDDEDYNKRIVYFLQELGINKMIQRVDYMNLDPSLFYYGSFGGGRIACKRLPHYIAFEVSPHALAYHGQQIVTYRETMGNIEFSYMKGSQEITALYSREAHKMRYSSDVVDKYLRRSKYYWEVPMLYNIVSTVPLSGMAPTGFSKSGITMESEYLICDNMEIQGTNVYADIENKEGKIERKMVDIISSLAPSVRKRITGNYFTNLNDLEVMQKATLMRNEAFNKIVFLGQKYKAIEVRRRSKHYDVIRKGVRYKLCSIFMEGGIIVKEDIDGDFRGKRNYAEVPLIPICDSLSDWISSGYYQSSTNVDLVGTNILYDVDDEEV